MKKQGTKTLWRVCFNDTGEFVHLFFEEVYDDENTLVVEENGRIVSALQLLPYTLAFKRNEIPVAYICGVSTHPESRGKGYMSQLMKEAEDVLKQRNIPLAFLIPANHGLFELYRRFDYKEAFWYATETYSMNKTQTGSCARISIAEVTASGLFPYFDKKLRERTAGMLHNEKDFMVIRKDLVLSRGKLLVASNVRNEVTGMAFTLPDEEKKTAYITELLYDNSSIKDQLLYATAELYHVSEVKYQVQPDSSNVHPKGMAKVIDENYFKERNIDIQTLFTEKEGYLTLMLD